MVKIIKSNQMAKANWYKMGDDSISCDENKGESEDQLHSGGMEVSRTKRKSKNKNNKSTKEKYIKASTLMFVNWTKGGKLVERLRLDKDRQSALTQFRVKYVEEGGDPTVDAFQYQAGQELDLWKRDLCFLPTGR